MGSSTAGLIEAWFAEHSDDGDFVYERKPSPYSVIGPSTPAGRIVFATKPSPVASAIHECAACSGIGMIGHYGLPSDLDVAWIRRVVAEHELLFLGDMDPVDLMIFAWLRARLQPKQIVHLGINDSYLAKLDVYLPESFLMQFSASERKSFPLLKKVFPDFRETVGEKCALTLERGRKIELDAIISATQSVAEILRPANTSEN